MSLLLIFYSWWTFPSTYDIMIFVYDYFSTSFVISICLQIPHFQKHIYNIFYHERKQELIGVCLKGFLSFFRFIFFL